MKLFGTPRERITRPSMLRNTAIIAGAAALVFVVSGCGSDSANTAQPSPINQEQLTELPEADTFGNLADVVKDAQPQAATEGEVIHPKEELVVYREVNGKPIAKLPSVQMGSPTWVPVIAKEGDWTQILLPTRPNGATGWIHGTPETVETAHNDYSVDVDLKNFKLDLKQAGKSVGNWTIGIGKAQYPTPTGRAYIIASIKETVNKYSPIVLPLSVHSDSHDTFGGGPGTVAIHTWPDESFKGKADSDGCIRVPKDALERLAEVPLGTMINIV